MLNTAALEKQMVKDALSSTNGQLKALTENNSNVRNILSNLVVEIYRELESSQPPLYLCHISSTASNVMKGCADAITSHSGIKSQVFESANKEFHCNFKTLP